MNNRPSSHIIGFGVALVVVGLMVAADAREGALRPGWWMVYPSIFAACIGGVVTLAGLGHGLSWTLDTADELAARRDQRRPPAPVVAETVPQPQPPDDAAENAWRLALERFFRAGDKAGGFSIRKLEGVVGSTTWFLLTDFYVSLEGGQVLRRMPGDEGTVWGHGWTLDDVTRKLALGTLPHPQGPVPSVEVYIANTTQQNAPRQRKTAVKARVVDIEPSRAVE